MTSEERKKKINELISQGYLTQADLDEINSQYGTSYSIVSNESESQSSNTTTTTTTTGTSSVLKKVTDKISEYASSAGNVAYNLVSNIANKENIEKFNNSTIGQKVDMIDSSMGDALYQFYKGSAENAEKIMGEIGGGTLAQLADWAGMGLNAMGVDNGLQDFSTRLRGAIASYEEEDSVETMFKLLDNNSMSGNLSDYSASGVNFKDRTGTIDGKFYGKGNIDLNNRQVKKNDDGTISTEKSISIEEDGKEVLIPTIINGEEVSEEDAIAYYKETGEYLGKFDSVEEADAYAETLHEAQEEYYNNVGSNTLSAEFYRGQDESLLGSTGKELIEMLGYQFDTYIMGMYVPDIQTTFPFTKLGVKMPVFSIMSGIGHGLGKGYSQEGYDNLMVWLNAGGEGYLEGLSEGISEMLKVGGSDLTDVIKGKISAAMPNAFAKTFSQLAANGVFEGLEEVFNDIGNWGLHNGLGYLEQILGRGDGEEYFEDLDWEGMIQDFLMASASSLAMDSATRYGHITAQVDREIKADEAAKGRKLNTSEKAAIKEKIIADFAQATEDASLGKLDTYGLSDYQKEEINKSNLDQDLKQQIVDTARTQRYTDAQFKELLNKAEQQVGATFAEAKEQANLNPTNVNEAIVSGELGGDYTYTHLASLKESYDNETDPEIKKDLKKSIKTIEKALKTDKELEAKLKNSGLSESDKNIIRDFKMQNLTQDSQIDAMIEDAKNGIDLDSLTLEELNVLGYLDESDLDMDTSDKRTLPTAESTEKATDFTNAGEINTALRDAMNPMSPNYRKDTNLKELIDSDITNPMNRLNKLPEEVIQEDTLKKYKEARENFNKLTSTEKEEIINKNRDFRLRTDEDTSENAKKIASEAAKVGINNTQESHALVEAAIALSEKSNVPIHFVNNNSEYAKKMRQNYKEELMNQGMSESEADKVVSNLRFPGVFNTKDGVIINFEDSIAKNKYITSVLLHEVTHSAQSSDKYYGKFRDNLFNFMKQYHPEEYYKYFDADGNIIRDGVLSNYSFADEEGLKQEIAARLMENFYKDEQFINKIVKENRTIAERIRDSLKYIVSFLHGKNGEIYRKYYNEYNKVLKLYDRALKTAKNSFSEESNGDNSFNVEKDYDGNEIPTDITQMIMNNTDPMSVLESSTDEQIKEMKSIWGDEAYEKLQEYFKKVKYETSSQNYHEITRDEAVDIIVNNVPQHLRDGWFRNADSSYKPIIESYIINNPEVRNAALNIAYSNYKLLGEFYTDNFNKNLSFDDFINQDITLYRGSNTEGLVDSDVFVAFSMYKNMAEKFLRNQDIPMSTIKVKLKDTLGMLNTMSESEVLVPRRIVDLNDIHYDVEDWVDEMNKEVDEEVDKLVKDYKDSYTDKEAKDLNLMVNIDNLTINQKILRLEELEKAYDTKIDELFDHYKNDNVFDKQLDNLKLKDDMRTYLKLTNALEVNDSNSIYEWLYMHSAEDLFNKYNGSMEEMKNAVESIKQNFKDELGIDIDDDDAQMNLDFYLDEQLEDLSEALVVRSSNTGDEFLHENREEFYRVLKEFGYKNDLNYKDTQKMLDKYMKLSTDLEKQADSILNASWRISKNNISDFLTYDSLVEPYREYNKLNKRAEIANSLRRKFERFVDDEKFGDNAKKGVDNRGNKVNPNMETYMENSKVRTNPNQNLINVFHTMTGDYDTHEGVIPFTTFNPLLTRNNYNEKFGRQIVNFFTDSKAMSTSYGFLGKVEEFNDQRITNMKDFEKRYKKDLIQAFNNAWDDDNRNPNWYADNIYDYDQFERYGRPDYTPAYYIAKNSKPIIRTLNNGQIEIGYTTKKGLDNSNNELILKKYDNEEDLFRNYPTDFATHKAEWQYSGYIDIQNPYVVDAEGRNWNNITDNMRTPIALRKEYDKLAALPQETKDALTKLANESIEYEKSMFNKVKELDNKVESIKTDKNLVLKNKIDVLKEIADTIVQRESLGGNSIYDYLASDKLMTPKKLDSFIDNLNLISEFSKLGVNGDIEDQIMNLEQEQDDLLENETDEEQRMIIRMRYKNEIKARLLEGEADTFNRIKNYTTENGEKLGDILKEKIDLARRRRKGEFNRYNYFEERDTAILPNIYKDFDNVKSDLLAIAEHNFESDYIEYTTKQKKQSDETNDIIAEVIEMNKQKLEKYIMKNFKGEERQAKLEALENETISQEDILAAGGYDGIIVNNLTDYGGGIQTSDAAHNVYVTLAANQFKSINNPDPQRIEDNFMYDVEEADTKFDLDNLTYIDYNNKKRTIPSNIVSNIVVDEEKGKFLKYTQLEKFYDLDISDMNKAIAIGSGVASIENEKGETDGYFYDDNYLYHFNIVNDGDFSIDEMENDIDPEILEEIENVGKKNVLQGINTINDESTRNELGNIGRLFESYGFTNGSEFSRMVKIARERLANNEEKPNNSQSKRNKKFLNGGSSNESFFLVEQINDTDSEGKKLSKGQQDYFRDSAIRVKKKNGWAKTIDKTGNLLVVYHGTNNDDFTIFNPDFIGSSNDTGWYGRGFYFAFTRSEAKTYGENVLSAYLNIKNPFNFKNEMQTYDGQDHGDVNYDLGAFLLNLNDKFSNIAENLNLRYTGEYDEEDNSYFVEKASAKEVANKIKEIYNSPNLKIVEVDDMGTTKYSYSYSDNINDYNIDEDIKEKMLKNWILNKSELDYVKKYRNDFKDITDSDISKMEEFFSENNVNFESETFGFQNDTREQAESMRLSEATYYVSNYIYRNLEMHTPETYIQDIGEEFTNELKRKGYDGVLQSDTGDEIVAFYPNQIKRIDNLNPTDNPDINFDVENDYQNRINSSMTMKEAQKMIEIAFINNNIYNWYDGQYSNGDEWLKGVGADEVAEYVDNTYASQEYLNRIYEEDETFGDEWFTSEIIEAYQNGTLTGKVKESKTQRLDLTQDTGYLPKTFYEPREATGGIELYEKANERVTNKNRDEVYKARADFIINAHNQEYLDSLGLAQDEVNKKLKDWANYPKKAKELSNVVNEGVALQNRWTGIENSSIVNDISISNEELGKLVKDIQGDSNGWQRKYITSTMLALDTHIDYSPLTFQFDQGAELAKSSAAGDYNPETDTIRIGYGYQNTTAHEIGHYIDRQWARELGFSNTFLSDGFQKLDNLTDEQKQFVINFREFIQNIKADSYIGSKYSGRDADYWQHNTEVFARFVGKFVEWTKNVATNGRYGYEEKYYKDNFTESQYREFIKILQEKAMLDTTNTNFMVESANVDNSGINVNEGFMRTSLPGAEFNAENAAELQDLYNKLATNTLLPRASKLVLGADEEALMNDLSNKSLEEILDEIREASTLNQEQQEESESQSAFTGDTMDMISDYRTKKQIDKKAVRDEFMQKFVNKGHYVDRLAEETGNLRLKYKYDRLLSVFNEAQYSLGEEQIDLNGNRVGDSLIDIFQEADDKDLGKQFDDYLLNRHNVDRYALDKAVFGNQVTDKDSAKKVAEYEKTHPEFKQWAEKVYNYNRNSIHKLVDAGMITEDFYNKLIQMYGSYVPTYRDIQDSLDENRKMSGKERVGNNAIGRATGGNQKILSVRQAMAEQTLQITRAIRMNEVGKELYRTIGTNNKIRKEITQMAGIAVDDEVIMSLGGDVVSEATDGTKEFTIFVNGKMSTFRISDNLFKAFDSNKIQDAINNSAFWSTILNPVDKAVQLNRNMLTTYSVGFMLNNPIKDMGDALINSKYGIMTYINNYRRAAAEIIAFNKGERSGSYYEEYVKNGGTSNTYFDYSKGLLPQESGGIFKKFLGGVTKVNEGIEQAPRVAEYISARENGASIDQALYEAADITTNFKRGGDVTKIANKYGANFLNASVQGFDKFIRNITGENGTQGYADLVAKSLLWGIVPSLLNHLVIGGMDDDEDENGKTWADYYDALPDYIKDSYYLIPNKDGVFYRIPKGRLVSLLGATARRTLETFQGESDAFDNYFTEVVGNSIAPNNPLTDNIISPIVQAATNNAWYEGDIVSSRLIDLPLSEQQDEKTDSFSNWVGESIRSVLPTSTYQELSTDDGSLTHDLFRIVSSPKLLNYVIDQYSGGFGDVFLPMATPYAEDNILENKFTTDSVMKNKYVSEFYDALDTAGTANNSEFATDTDKLVYKYLSEVSSEVGSLYSDKREIESSSELSDSDKKAQAKDIQRQIDDKVEAALEALNSAEINEGSASFNGTTFYKNVNGNWTATDSSDDNSGLNSMAYADYLSSVAEATSEKRTSEGNDSATLNNTEKVTLLKNATYSSEEKEAIYLENIQSKSDNKYDVLKYIGGNKVSTIDDYLDYLSADLDSDKKDDGTMNGSTISGSKKTKVTNYLNSSDFSYLQRLYLYGTTYKLSSSERQTIENYMKTNNYTQEMRNNLLKGLASSNRVQLKDTNYIWK